MEGRERHRQSDAEPLGPPSRAQSASTRAICVIRVPALSDFIVVHQTLTLFDERSFAQVLHCLAQLSFGVHHDGTVPRNGLLQRLT